MSTPVPATGLSFWSRFFRPSRWRLWSQFALLGAFILIIPILLTSYRLLQSARTVLIEHEIIDLADESNLRVNDFREDVAYLAGDVRRLCDAQPATPDSIRESLKLDKRPPPSNDPADVAEVRRKHLYDTLIGVYRFSAGKPAAAVLPEDTPAREQALRKVLAKVDAPLNASSLVNQSPLHLQPADGKNKPARCLLAIGKRVGDFTFAVVIDFSKYIAQRQAMSPRHYFLVTDPTGQLLVRPTPLQSIGLASVTEVTNWEYPTHEDQSWFAPLEPDLQKRRLAKAVDDGGARLKAIEMPALAFRYRKGYFGDSLDLTKTLGKDRAKKAAIELNSLLAEKIALDPQLRCGEVSSQYGYMEVSHPDLDRLQAVCAVVEAWWKRNGTGSVRWTRPLECKTFQGQLVPLRLELTDADKPGWLVMAASVEELREDIDDRFDRIHTRWVLPTLAVSLVLGVGLVLTLTHTLNRLARAAVRLGRGENVRLPLGGSREVSDLAQTLDAMVGRVRERDRELTDRAARYQTILRAAGEGVVITNSAGVIEEANKAAGRMFGKAPEELLGLTVASLLHNPFDLPSPSDSTQDPTLPYGQTSNSLRGKRPAGDEFWLEISQRPVVLPDRVVIVCVFRDVTRQRADAERIQRMNEELDMRVRVRTAELEEANGKLEVTVRDAQAALRAKESFVAGMNHELRQPLHIIIGFTEAMKEEAADTGNEDVVRDANKILFAANQLLALINDILDMAKISAGKMKLAIAPFPLARLVEDMRTLVGPLAEANGNRFEVTAEPSLGIMVAEERRVRQILLNLLSNAFKFTRNGVVRFTVERITQDGREWVRFRVADNGKGMTEDQVGRLFQQFYQADSSTTRGAGGTGLGLAISKSYNEWMGGQPIRVTSAMGSGSEFVVTLPAVVESLPEARPPANPLPILTDGTPSAEGRTVLVIDDDPNVRELMRRFLEKEGFAVVEAGTGEDGYAKARELHPCVVTLDVMMPESDGWSVLARMKADPVTADIPVVMLTIVDDHGRGYSLGAADYLTKPIDWNRLGTILRKHLVRGRGDTVLVVDDSPDNRAVVRRYLDREGWKTAEAADGEEALRRFAETQPAIILLDLMMPVLDGFGFLDELAKRFPDHRVPVIVLTAKELTAEDFDRLNGRVARILEKGDLASLEHLLALVRRSMRPPGDPAASHHHQTPPPGEL